MAGPFNIGPFAPGNPLDTYNQLQAMRAQGQSEAPSSGGKSTVDMPKFGPVDIAGSIDAGSERAERSLMGRREELTPYDPAAGSGSKGLLGFDPRVLDLARELGGGGNENMALVRAGIGMAEAGGRTGNFMSALAAGAGQGLDALARMRESRAERAMKLMGMTNEAGYRNAILQQQANVLDETRRGHDLQMARAGVDDDRAERTFKETGRYHDILAGQAKDNATNLLEQRYLTNDKNRRDLFFKTGQWQKLPGDAEHGIDGPPSELTYDGPLVDDPNISFKEKQKLIVARPKAEQATSLLVKNLTDLGEKAEELLKHPGLGKATGFGGEMLSKVPGTDAADFAAAKESLLSGTFVNNLQAMRNANETGGGVGNVTEREGDKMAMLQPNLSQAQTTKQYKQGLKDIVDYARSTNKIIKDTHIKTYGDEKKPWETKEEPKTVTGDDTDALIDKYLKPQ